MTAKILETLKTRLNKKTVTPSSPFRTSFNICKWPLHCLLSVVIKKRSSKNTRRLLNPSAFVFFNAVLIPQRPLTPCSNSSVRFKLPQAPAQQLHIAGAAYERVQYFYLNINFTFVKFFGHLFSGKLEVVQTLLLLGDMFLCTGMW